MHFSKFKIKYRKKEDIGFKKVQNSAINYAIGLEK